MKGEFVCFTTGFGDSTAGFSDVSSPDPFGLFIFLSSFDPELLLSGVGVWGYGNPEHFVELVYALLTSFFSFGLAFGMKSFLSRTASSPFWPSLRFLGLYRFFLSGVPYFRYGYRRVSRLGPAFSTSFGSMYLFFSIALTCGVLFVSYRLRHPHYIEHETDHTSSSSSFRLPLSIDEPVSVLLVFALCVWGKDIFVYKELGSSLGFFLSPSSVCSYLNTHWRVVSCFRDHDGWEFFSVYDARFGTDAALISIVILTGSSFFYSLTFPHDSYALLRLFSIALFLLLIPTRSLSSRDLTDDADVPLFSFVHFDCV